MAIQRTPVAVTCALVCLFTPGRAAAQAIDPSYRADTEELLRMTGAAQLGAQFVNIMYGQILEDLKQSQPNAPTRMLEVIRQVLEEEFNRAFSGPDFISRTVAIYARHFTHEDVRGLLTFYRSELGRKVIGVMPSVLQESMAVGQQWGQEIMPGVMGTLEQRLRSEGFIK